MGEDGTFEGAIALISDISEQKLALNALKRANHQLSILSAITRHDINNELMIILGSFDLVASSKRRDSFEKYMDGIEISAHKIQKLIEFTREFETLGSKIAGWIGVLSIVRSVFSMITRETSLSLITEFDSDIEIYADPLFPKVLYLLMENSIRHGIRVTEMRVSSEHDSSGYHIVYEDNGIGIPDTEKEVIFEKGHGENTGLGLFFAAEILSVTDLSIRETGIYGKGARFDILIPEGKCRKKEQNNLS